jgi:6-hydroxynicotinate 3-monooxygenase
MSADRRIAVIGAGLGGSTVAGLLQREGLEVGVYEQAERFDRIGAGIHVTANVMKVLRRLGVEQELSDLGMHPEVFLSRKWDSGEVLFALPLGAEGRARYGADYITVHRGDLHAAINSSLAPNTIKFGKRLVHLEQTGGVVRLRFADGTETEADMVIGADGVNSKVREKLVGPQKPQFTGRVAHRAIYPSTLLGGIDLNNCTKWWGPKSHILIYYIRRSREEIYLVSSAPQTGWNTESSWLPCGHDEVLAAFTDFHPEVRKVIATAPALTKWPIFEGNVLEKWSSGRIVLLGDACHAMRPYMAQGAAMAIEDAAVLARCLVQYRGDDYAKGFACYEATRIPRTRTVHEISMQNNFLREPSDPTWVFGYDALAVPLSGQRLGPANRECEE